jgi:hypothetical protein
VDSSTNAWLGPVTQPSDRHVTDCPTTSSPSHQDLDRDKPHSASLPRRPLIGSARANRVTADWQRCARVAGQVMRRPIRGAGVE